MARGGAREGAGRKPNQPNKATADLKELARQYVPSAIVELARLAEHAESEAARVGAIKELFDRAYGKATQMIGGDADNPLRAVMRVELVGLTNDHGADSPTA